MNAISEGTVPKLKFYDKSSKIAGATRGDKFNGFIASRRS